MPLLLKILAFPIMTLAFLTAAIKHAWFIGDNYYTELVERVRRYE